MYHVYIHSWLLGTEFYFIAQAHQTKILPQPL